MTTAAPGLPNAMAPRLRVSENRRFLVTEQGAPFFWLGDTYRYGAHMPWYERLDAPGARQMKPLRALLESRPFLSRIPYQSLLVGALGDDDGHLQATRDADGSYALVYSPLGRPVTLDLAGLGQGPFRAWWCDPRTGASSPAGESTLAAAVHEFVPPSAGEDHDWGLVVDREERSFAPPGRAKP
jgi:YD repeat-containing protein